MDTDIDEYGEELLVEINQLLPEHGEEYKNVISKSAYLAYKKSTWVVKASNEGGYNGVEIDLVSLLKWVKYNMPNIWNGIL